MNIIFAGTPEFSTPALEALIASEHTVQAVYTQPDRPAGRGRKIQISAIKQCALDNNLNIEQPVNFKSDEAINTLKNYKPDLIIVVAYGLILPTAILEAPRFGCINIHASLLPRWRGAAPIQRAILAGDSETGITMMQMDKGLDTGDILSKTSCKIATTDTTQSLHDKLAQQGRAALIQLLPSIENGQLAPAPQNSEFTTYAEKLTKQEALIDWNQPASELLNAIRAFNPWPVSFTSLENKTMRVWQADSSTQNCEGAPGSVQIIDKKMVISCKDSCLEITELQLAGKRRMATKDYLSAHSPKNLILGKN